MMRLFPERRFFAESPYYLSPTTLTCYEEEFKGTPIPERLKQHEHPKGVFVINLPEVNDVAKVDEFKEFIKSLPHGDNILHDLEEMWSNKITPRFS